ncbi:hypothetical protein SAMN05660642_04872 [Geodermatophilus siccatus]|uniref:Uncharacterized protein n=1 Tax=Geodermatophilus siccatus TaxID=1137991 RepID=A0A1H0BIL5_9ACTN|nr:hypothetical protein [Geodermatophilus siccatus]SDN45456.1 hypothetical protein SAMN05660642_04872 [Geodermatophilus siccatus]
MRDRLLAVPLLPALAAGPLGPPPEASAAWAVAGEAVLPGQAARMPAGSTTAPSVTAAGVHPAVRTFTVTWPTVRPFGGRPATGYVLERTATLSNAPMDTGSCTGAVSDGVYVPADPGAATQTCTDSTTLNLGSVRYTVAPVRGRWVGTPSTASTAVL